MPGFKQAYKKLHEKMKSVVDEVVEQIKVNPDLGDPKKGDLLNVFVYKFKIDTQHFLLAYEYDPKTRILLLLGTHENFYRDLKRP